MFSTCNCWFQAPSPPVLKVWIQYSISIGDLIISSVLTCIVYFLIAVMLPHNIQTDVFSRAHIGAQWVTVIGHVLVGPDTTKKIIDHHNEGNLSKSKQWKYNNSLTLSGQDWVGCSAHMVSHEACQWVQATNVDLVFGCYGLAQHQTPNTTKSYLALVAVAQWGNYQVDGSSGGFCQAGSWWQNWQMKKIIIPPPPTHH